MSGPFIRKRRKAVPRRFTAFNKELPLLDAKFGRGGQLMSHDLYATETYGIVMSSESEKALRTFLAWMR